MTTDAVIRTAAVAAAVALLVAPKWGVILTAAVRLAEAARDAAKAHGKTAARVAAAALIVGAAWGKVPLPSLPASGGYTFHVAEPDDAMKSTVRPIAEAMRAVPIADRMLWAQVWSKAAVVAAGDAVSTEVAFTDTKSLRLFTVLALDIGWRRIGQNRPGEYAWLRDAIEAAFAQVLGTDEVAVTKDLRERYADLCRAIAWAGINAG